MVRKTVSGIMSILLVLSMLSLLSYIQPVRAQGIIYINADGSITPSTAPIYTTDNITYTLTGNITADTYGIVIERDNIVLDGAGFTVQGNWSGTGITLSGRSNVTIKNAEIATFYDGIYLGASSNNIISGNTITANNESQCNGIRIDNSPNNSISGNNITNNFLGIYSQTAAQSSSNESICGNNITGNSASGITFDYSSNNIISGNNIRNNYGGIGLEFSSSNSISGNTITNNVYDGIGLGSSSNYNIISGNNITANSMNGIDLFYSSNNRVSGNIITANRGIVTGSSSGNIISGNNITNSSEGVEFDSSSSNSIFDNNFFNNTIQVYSTSDSVNVWDNGYPSGGNYWSDYNGTDSYSGPYQNLTGSDGIGDTPYIIDANNLDNYSLMTPHIGVHDIEVTNVTPSKTVVGQGFSTNINVTAANQGDYTETFNVTTYLTTPPPLPLEIIINITTVSLDAGQNITISLAWNTTASKIGNWTVRATAGYNTLGCTILITIPGDINGDLKVSLADLVLLANAYGSTHQMPSKWNPNADINGDGKVSLSDLVLMANHYGQHYP